MVQRHAITTLSLKLFNILVLLFLQDLLQSHLTPSCGEIKRDDQNAESQKRELTPDELAQVESHVFYLKMEGDYFRYLAEVATGDDRERK